MEDMVAYRPSPTLLDISDYDYDLAYGNLFGRCRICCVPTFVRMRYGRSALVMIFYTLG